MQLLHKNYFQIFSLPENYNLDLDTLADSYRKLQAQVHPDKFASSSEPEKMLAVQSASLLNEAFETLTAPQKRAAYLLNLQDIDVTVVDQAELSSDLLLEQIQFREELEEIPHAETAIENLDALRRKIETRISQSQQIFATNLEAKQFSEAKTNYFEMQYCYKLIQDIEAVEEELLGY